MDKRSITTWILIAVGLILLVWDIIVAANTIRGDTISEITRDTSYRVWFIPWAIGGIAGHLFWHKDSAEKWNVPAMVISSLILVGVNLIALNNEWTIGSWLPISVFAAGIVAGHVWWPQRAKTLN
jgi:hypothetical protein